MLLAGARPGGSLALPRGLRSAVSCGRPCRYDRSPQHRHHVLDLLPGERGVDRQADMTLAGQFGPRELFLVVTARQCGLPVKRHLVDFSGQVDALLRGCRLDLVPWEAWRRTCIRCMGATAPTLGGTRRGPRPESTPCTVRRPHAVHGRRAQDPRVDAGRARRQTR